VAAQRLRAERLYRCGTRALPNVPISLNLYDIMFVVARKGVPASFKG